MDKNTHVYCTHCLNYIYPSQYCFMGNCLHNSSANYCAKCPCDGCNCIDAEDSRPFSERPNYINYTYTE